MVTAATPLSAAVGVVIAGLITLLSRVPASLPGIALGSTALFYVERGAVALAVFTVAFGLITNPLLGNRIQSVSTSGLTFSDQATRAAQADQEATNVLKARADAVDEALKIDSARIETLQAALVQIHDQIASSNEPRASRIPLVRRVIPHGPGRDAASPPDRERHE